MSSWYESGQDVFLRCYALPLIFTSKDHILKLSFQAKSQTLQQILLKSLAKEWIEYLMSTRPCKTTLQLQIVYQTKAKYYKILKSYTKPQSMARKLLFKEKPWKPVQTRSIITSILFTHISEVNNLERKTHVWG